MDRRIALALLLALGVVSCGGIDRARQARTEALVAIEAAVGQQRYPEAEALARRFLPVAADRLDESCPALLALGRSLEGQGRTAEALDVLATLGRRCRTVHEDSARGLLEVALLARRLGNTAVAGRAFARVVTAFPDDLAARRAAEEVRNLHVDAGRRGEAIESLRRLYRAVPDREVSPYLLFLAARLVEGDSREPAAAHLQAMSLYRRIAEAHPRSGLVDDALLAAARHGLAAGRAAEAGELLERLLSRREGSYLLGSYDTDSYPDAAFLRAEAAARAGEPASSVVDWYDAFARWFPRDSRAPLARLRAARILEAAGDLGAAKSRLRRLASASPKTAAGRWAAEALAGRDPGPEPSGNGDACNQSR